MMGENTKKLEIAERKVGMVSLGCPKALVDSERILTRLKAEDTLYLHPMKMLMP